VSAHRPAPGLDGLVAVYQLVDLVASGKVRELWTFRLVGWRAWRRTW
jgi:hypothetical protein